MDKTYINNKTQCIIAFDDILFPEIENIPKKYAILERNRWMIKHANFLIAYVDYSWGGAFKAFEFALKNKIPYINLGKLDSI